MQLEICVDNFESLETAIQYGADRIELCCSLREGGLTPSYAFVEAALKSSKPVFVMIRPRSCDFLYSSQEIEIMHRDIYNARKLGAPGVVFGVLNAEGQFDVEAMRSLVKQAADMSVTCHRAIDQVKNAFAAIEILSDLGIERILTSGQADNPYTGIDTLRKMVVHARKRVKIMAAGVTPADVVKIIKNTAVDEVHSAAANWRSSHMNYANVTARMGEAEDFSLNVVDGKIVQALKTQITEISQPKVIG
jgi:copper homeostasis protein